MDQELTNYILTTLYFAVWVATFVWYHYKHRYIDGGSGIIAFYVLYASVSIYSINDDIINSSGYAYEPVTLWPYLYLYAMMMIALAPVIYFHNHPTRQIASPDTRVIKVLAVIIIVCALLQLPNIISNFGSGVVKLITDSDAGKDSYDEHLKEAQDSGSGISNIPSIIYNSLQELSIFIMFYFLTLKKKNYLLIGGLAIATVIGILLPVMNGMRGGVVISIQTTILAFLLFRQYLPKLLNRWINIVGSVMIAVLMVPVLAITLSRAGGNRTITSFATWYIGQGSLYFNNSALDAGGTRHADRTFNMAKRLIDSDTPKNFVERRDKYHNLKIDDNLFSTFVGDFVIDFGPIVAVLIFIAFFGWATSALRVRGDTTDLSQLLLLYFVACISMQGGMTLYSFSDTSNLKVITIMGLYAYLVYHKKLLEKYPC